MWIVCVIHLGSFLTLKISSVSLNLFNFAPGIVFSFIVVCRLFFNAFIYTDFPGKCYLEHFFREEI